MSEHQDPLNWRHRINEIGVHSQDYASAATPEACEALSRIFGNVRCLELQTTYRVKPLGPGRYRVAGHFKARLELVCGVTLDPIEQLIDDPFEVEFRDDASDPDKLAAEFDPLAGDDPEPLRHGVIDVGRYITEKVASAIDPFPRAADAELEQTEAGGNDPVDDAENPFAALEQLRSGHSRD